jgi:hypothetical protein
LEGCDDVLDAHKQELVYMWSIPKSESDRELLALAVKALASGTDADKHECHYTCQGLRVCYKIWFFLFKICPKKWAKFLKVARAGHVHPPVDYRTYNVVRERPKHEALRLALLRVYHEEAEFLPDVRIDEHVQSDLEGETCIKPDQNTLDLMQNLGDPTRLRFEDYCQDPAELPPKWISPTSVRELHRRINSVALFQHAICISRTWFREVWAAWKNTILIRNSFQHKPCEDCERYKIEIAQSRNPADRRVIGAAYQTHLSSQMSDRRVHGMMEAAAIEFFSGGFSDSASLVIDGMDQAKFRCPRNLPAAKLFADLERPTLHLCGVIAAGHAENYWVTDGDVKKDSNTEVDMVARAIDDIHVSCLKRGMPMPKHLNVLADNCSREMKNQYTLMFGCWLVATGAFASVTFNYLVKGHSHSGIGAQVL